MLKIQIVIPTKVGINLILLVEDSPFHGNDEYKSL